MNPRNGRFNCSCDVTGQIRPFSKVGHSITNRKKAQISFEATREFTFGCLLFCLVSGDHHDSYHQNPQPYNFGYAVQSHDGTQFRKEEANGHGQVQGSYGYRDQLGILREVHYVADHNGFRAQVKTNEPGTINKDPADVKVVANGNHGLHNYGNLFTHGNRARFQSVSSPQDYRNILKIHHPQPYKFGYSVKDHHGEQHREESGDGVGSVVGNYGFTDDRGIARQVNYVADHSGFRAQVKTNEPGTANQNPAAVQMISNDPYARGAAVPFLSQPTGVAVAPVVYGLGAGYAGLGYGGNGLGNGGYGLGNGGYGLGYNGYGGALGYSDLLGGYGGLVNYGASLVGGAIRGYDSRFVALSSRN
ncbi:unnamed protein product [Larinioides sclopetarius]|uniref:Cuticle protein 16.8 n=1 Tax=Larinioides sclopetarius TaxID=280406 RepID=A0AAV2AXK4_9ARAC